eukprot:1380915-Amorphochlora_amoeboformis.AAC.1
MEDLDHVALPFEKYGTSAWQMTLRGGDICGYKETERAREEGKEIPMLLDPKNNVCVVMTCHVVILRE